MNATAANVGQSAAEVRIEAMRVFGVPLERGDDWCHLQSSDVERADAADANHSIMPKIECCDFCGVMMAEEVSEADSV